MQITNLKLQNFRNYDFVNIDFEENWNILVGENGAGKTNILESIYYSISTRSPRTSKIDNLIKENEKNFSINLEFKEDNIDLKSNLKNFYERTTNHYSKKSKKIIKLNSNEIKLFDLIGTIPFIFFVPEDILIIKGDGADRRKLLDFVLFQIFPNYKFLINKYSEVLKKRNFIIKEIKTKKIDVKYLEEWDENLIKTGVKIFLKRLEICQILNKNLDSEFYKIYFKNKKLGIKYLSIFKNVDSLKNCEDKNFNINNLKEEELCKIYKELLSKNYNRDLSFGFTTTGIHRDDYQFFYEENDIKLYGSQGQQRLYILTLKILLADIIKQFLNKNTILIFDDIFSELDIENTKILIDNCSKNLESQIFVSSVDIDKILTNNLFENKNVKIFNVKDGKVEIK
jgi:DNA replication and repair protein RecF